MRTTLLTTRGQGALCLVSLLFIDLMLLGASSSGQTLNAEAIANRINQLQNQLTEERQAAVNDDATARRAFQQQAAMARLSGSGAATLAQLNATLAQSAANSANAHRARAQRLQDEINQLNRQVGNGNSLVPAAPSAGFNFTTGTPTAKWSASFLGGGLTLSADRVRYDDRDGHGNLRKDSFDVSCSEIKEWKPNKTNFMNAFAGANPQMWDFHIRLRNGKNANFEASTEVEMNEVLAAVSKACGQT